MHTVRWCCGIKGEQCVGDIWWAPWSRCILFRVSSSSKLQVPDFEFKLTSYRCIFFRVPSSTCCSTWDFTSFRFRVLFFLTFLKYISSKSEQKYYLTKATKNFEAARQHETWTRNMESGRSELLTLSDMLNLEWYLNPEIKNSHVEQHVELESRKDMHS